ncbi:50S ribosomal protein L9 [Stagnimonas aquatica]|uniref:Large ribosomal subunit protein bL9 n=1 Tax=Stagnimonas aquatica TaxID=2689987 RepID=A0A3N0V5L6_9GAMM|nr:50S ribosomal protein L9 [Stagnimonas aquatica]ROH87748.1 50S ribosomal protein L9 [Stagnimonas aquatica]
MELILLEKIKHLGDLGDVVDVKPGYGRNFLLPQGKALQATDSNKKVFEDRKAELVKKAVDSINAAKTRAAKLEGAVVVVTALASEEGKLYGSVGPAEIARAAEGQKLDVEKSEINLLAGPIRTTGEVKVLARLHSEVEVEFSVKVEAERA